MLVVDASVLANALADDDADGDRARERLLADVDLHAPELVDLEVLSVLRRHLLAGSLDGRRATFAIADLQELAVVRYPHRRLAERIWGHRDNLTGYDAAYVALAEVLGCALVTSDERLAAAAGVRCPVEVLS